MEPMSSEESLLKETVLVAAPPVNFGELLRSRREEAGMSVAELARKVGVVRTTIHNIEQGLTTASPQTLKRLAALKSLRLTELDASQEASLDASFTQQYDPMKMVKGMDSILNGPGGQLEQSLLYLDPQSATDWYALSNSEQYITAFRSKIPLEKLAERIMRESKGLGLDVDGLGCGDGKTETALMQRLADLMPAPPDLQLYLLDISHVLLYSAYRYAYDALAPRCISVAAFHGDFNDISKNPLLYMNPRSVPRRRIFLMMGFTFGNIHDEPWLLRDLAVCAQPGDLAVIDCPLVRAPADQPEMVHEREPVLRSGKPPEAHHRFLLGPIKRHCEGLTDIKLRSVLSTHCLIPGSYAIEFWGDVGVEYESKRRFMIQRVKRYDLEKLSQFLSTIGWRTIQSWKYGPDKLAAVLLIQRQ